MVQKARIQVGRNHQQFLSIVSKDPIDAQREGIKLVCVCVAPDVTI